MTNRTADRPSFAHPHAPALHEVTLAIERGLFVTRLIIPALVALAVFLFRDNLDNWVAVLGLLALVAGYNLGLVGPTMQRFPRFSHTMGILLDTAILLGCAFLTVPDLAARGVTADFWLVFLLFIVGAAFHFGPVGALLYIVFLSAFFAWLSLTYFPPDSITAQNLPVRLTFFFAIGGLVWWLTFELNRRRRSLEAANRSLEEQNRDTIMMLATIVEARDSFTGAHLQRIRYYSEAIARRLGYREPDVSALGEASITHDVGKAYTPDAVLKKAGPLTAEERRIMEQHAADGARILGERPAFRVHREIARHHHERWDGTGYPDRLAGTAIPLSARIVAVADVYDALTSRRPYKEPWESARAAEEVFRLAGTQFDPDVVEAFRQAYRAGEIDAIRARYGEPAAQFGSADVENALADLGTEVAEPGRPVPVGRLTGSAPAADTDLQAGIRTIRSAFTADIAAR
ncbi:MAG: HD domain-containing phosphohydrolase [Chloroflexota bacterium]|nr:HD domain-containing protein [Dehalococcoidia bacterium]MDW8254691.1 HD domain-containing phosphohydrolase [Chloroflexota bacterium]